MRVAPSVDDEAELCRRLYPRVRAWSRRHARDAAEAADLAQHALVIVLERLRAGTIDEPEHLTAFVLGVCRNVLLDWRKGERRRAGLFERFGGAAETIVAPAPVLDGARLRGCVERLGERDRTVVVLTFWADRDADEIGRTLTMSPGAVRVARHRALERLHRCLEADA